MRFLMVEGGGHTVTVRDFDTEAVNEILALDGPADVRRWVAAIEDAVSCANHVYNDSPQDGSLPGVIADLAMVAAYLLDALPPLVDGGGNGQPDYRAIPGGPWIVRLSLDPGPITRQRSIMLQSGYLVEMEDGRGASFSGRLKPAGVAGPDAVLTSAWYIPEHVRDWVQDNAGLLIRDLEDAAGVSI